jgi:hypothetical protein
MRAMKIPFIFALLVLMVLPAAAQHSRTDLQNMYMQFLRQEGYSPSIDGDGDIVFKAEGRSYYIVVNDGDLLFFQLIYPNFWEIESERERAKVAAAASYANRMTKVAKVYLTNRDDTSIATEILIAQPEDFKKVFSRCLSSITTALGHFRGRMNGNE